jgi:cell division septum initiation protein DivIVA
MMSFDDYDDELIDDTFEQPAPVQARLGESEMILRQTIDIIVQAPSVPLSSSPRVNRDEIVELLQDALDRLPEEIRQARWMLKERQEFLDKTKREADEILGAARQQAERMVQRTEVVRAAEARARQVIDAADEETRRLKHETEDFLDQRLGSFEILLGRLQKTVHNGRERLSIGDKVPPPEAEEPIEQQEDSAGFFDQDE